MKLNKKKIVITGGEGRFARTLKNSNINLDISFPNKKELNILSLNSIEKYLKKIKPKYVLHAAGLSRPMNIHDNNISKSIFFEDTAKNLKPARELGMSTVWIENDFNRKEADILKEYINFTGSDIKSILSNMLKFEKR